MAPIDDQDMYKIAFNIKNELDYDKNSSNIIRKVLKEKKWPKNPQWERYNVSFMHNQFILEIKVDFFNF